MSKTKRVYEQSKRLSDFFVREILRGNRLAPIHRAALAKYPQYCPRSMTSVMKHYGDVISQAQLQFEGALNDKAMSQLDENPQLLMLALKAKAGWKTEDKLDITVDADDEDGELSAVEQLSAMLKPK